MPIDKITGKNRNYLEEELEFVKRVYGTTRAKDIADTLNSQTTSGVTISAILSLAIRLDLRKDYNKVELSENEKFCNYCKNIKSKDDFHPKIKGSRKILSSYCKECSSIMAKEKRLQQKVNEKFKLQERAELKARLHAENKTNKCVRCNEVKPATIFEINYKDKSLLNICRVCRRKQQTENKMKRILNGKEW